MTDNIVKIKRNGTPPVLLENLQDIEDDIEYMLVVRVMKDKRISFDWTNLTNSLAALGAVEMLRQEVIDWSQV